MTNLLRNPGFEEGWWRKTDVGQSYAEIFVPEHWVAYWKEGMPVPHDPSNQSGYARPEMHVINREAPFLDPLRVRSGSRATKLFTFFRVHDAGLYQQVSGIEPGARLRGTGWAHAWSSTDDDPRTSDGAGSQPYFIRASEYDPGEHGQEGGLRNASFRVGIDPAGGTNPWADSVVWGEAAHIYNSFAQIPPLEVTAEADTVTFFVRSSVLWPFKHCDAYFDDMRMDITTDPASPLHVSIRPERVVVGEPFEVSATGGLGVETITVSFTDDRIFDREVRAIDARAVSRAVAVEEGDYEVRVASGHEVSNSVRFHVYPQAAALSPGFVPPREPYERTYLLLPPGAGGEWLHAVRESGVWDRRRWTIGGSADDAGIGPAKRRVVAVNPQSWPGDLKAFFDEHYPGVEYVALRVATPEALADTLGRLA